MPPSSDFDGRPPSPPTDWLFSREGLRLAEHQMEERAEWQFHRSAGRDEERRKLRNGYERAEWLFKRGRERAQQRRDQSRKQADDNDDNDDDDKKNKENERGWFDNLMKRDRHAKADRKDKDHKESRRHQQRRDKPRHHQFRQQSVFGGVYFDL